MADFKSLSDLPLPRILHQETIKYSCRRFRILANCQNYIVHSAFPKYQHFLFKKGLNLNSPLAGLTLAEAVSLAEEAVPVLAEDLLPGTDVAEHLNAGAVAAGGHELKKEFKCFF